MRPPSDRQVLALALGLLGVGMVLLGGVLVAVYTRMAQ